MSSLYRVVLVGVVLVVGNACVLGPFEGDVFPSRDHPIDDEFAAWVTDGTQKTSSYHHIVQCRWFSWWLDIAPLIPSGDTTVRDGGKYHEMVVSPYSAFHTLPTMCWTSTGISSRPWRSRTRVIRRTVSNGSEWALFHYGHNFLSCSANYGYSVAQTVANCSVGGDMTIYAK